MIIRHANWPELLLAYIAERESRPFKWGKGRQDCCSFAFGAALVMTGFDAMDGIRDYSTAEEADLLLGENPLREYVDARFPALPSPAFAGRGDIALCENDGNPTLMIVEGATLVGPGKRKLERLQRAHVQFLAWKV